MAIPTQRQIHAKLEVIRPNGMPVDVTDYLESVDVELGSIENLGTGTGADIGVRSLTAKLRNTPGKRFAPRDKTSDWNIVDGQWEPLLWPYRGIRFQVFPQRGVGPGQSLTDIVDSQEDFAKGVFTNTKTFGGTVVLAEGATSGNWRKNISLSQVKYVQGSKIEWEAVTDILYYDDQVSRDSEDVIGDSEDAIGDSEDSAAVFFNALFNTQAQTQQTALTMQTRVNGGAWNDVTNGGSISGLYEGQDVHASTLEVRAVMSAPAGFSPELHSVKVTVTWAPAWITLFEGYLGDNIRTEPHYVEIRCRDKSKRLQDAYIDVKKEYEGPISAEVLIQAIINDYVDDPPTLHCPIPSGITFDKMVVEYVSVWDAIQNVAAQMGWYLGYLWNGAQYALTFIEPPRSKNTPDYQLIWTNDFYHESLDISDSNIRNVVTVTYRDKTSGERETVTVQNNDSIAQYTRRAMQIEEADTSLIDTHAKAQKFAEAILWDLSELSATDYLDMPLFPQLDLFSTFTVENPLTSSTVDFYSVQSVRHSLNFSENGRFRTEVVATGRVVGGRSKWTNMETRPGRPGAPIDGDRIPPGELRADRLPDYSLDADKFVVGLKPPILVTSKPNFPDPRYPDDTILFYTADSRLYRVVGNDWVPMVASDFSELTGKITETQIGEGVIKTPHLATNAVTADKLTVDTTTTNKIIAGIAQIGGLSADYIKAGTISYDRLNVAYAIVQSAYASGDPPATLTVPSDRDGWNLAVWPNINWIEPFPNQSWYRNTIVFNHQTLGTMGESIVVQFSVDGITWTSPYIGAYMEMGPDEPGSIGNIGDGKLLGVKLQRVSYNQVRFDLYTSKLASERPVGLHVRFRRNAIG